MSTAFDVGEAKNLSTYTYSGRVCMHVLTTARTDYRVLRSATALIEAGYKVSIVDIEGENSQYREEYVQGIGLKHIVMPNSFLSTRFRKQAFFRAMQVFIRGVLKLLWTPADIYHAHDVTALPACYIAALLRHKPLIFDAHELPLSELEGAHRRWFRVLLKRSLAYMMSHSTRVITTSPSYAQEMRNRYHISEVSLLRNYPKYQAVQKNNRLQQFLSLNPNVHIALYQGNIQPDRGLDKLVYAAKFLDQNIVIVMMGKGLEETLDQLKALIASNGVADRVKIIPPVPYKELLEWTASADIGLNVLPPDYSLSIRMCLPNKLFEYLMAGLPVLSSELDAVVDVIKKYNVGQIVCSLAPEDIGAAINALLAGTDLLDQMHYNALDVAREEFHWEKERQELIRIYHNVLAEQK